jgi:hypothetical protein
MVFKRNDNKKTFVNVVGGFQEDLALRAVLKLH